MESNNIREQIIHALKTVALSMDSTLVEPMNDETVLLDSGLDSLGFAMLVAQLEEELGFDPFALSEDPVYPNTLGEFIDFYESNSP